MNKELNDLDVGELSPAVEQWALKALQQIDAGDFEGAMETMYDLKRCWQETDNG